jgi:predicted ribosomally synthesized peptide with SipW-like signal peptide
MARKILLTLLVMGAFGAVSGAATFSAFSSQTSNSTNSFAAGTVQLTDNDLGAAMLSLSNAQPGATDTSCILVTYAGSLSSTVRLYGAVAGALAPYVTLTVTRGDDPTPVFDDCNGFVADPTDYVGAGAGVVYQDALSAFPASYAAGLVDPLAASPETWTTGETHTYRFAVSLADDNGAQGLSSTASFTWEARNQ